MLEAMIALLIFSVGLLGLAGLQAGALQNNKTADLRSIAIIAAHDMAERIRANQRGVSNNYNNVTALAPSATPSVPGTDCTTSVCNTDQLADWDAYQWQTSLRKLPSGTGSVQRVDRFSPFTITVMWDEAHTGATGTGCSGVATTDLKCYSMTFMP